MELRDYLRILRRGWPIVLALTILGTAAGIGITLTTTKIYQANVQLFVATSTTDSATQLAQGNTFTQNRVQSYTSAATSPDVTGPVIKQLGLNLTEQQLAAKISADAPLNKVLINLKVTDHDPATAAKLANALAAQFANVIENKIEQTDATGKPVVKLTVLHPATTPESPIKPKTLLNVGLGFVLGLLVGIGVVVLRDVLDNTVKTPADFEDLNLAVLGLVPFDKRTGNHPIAFRADPHGVRAEAYRQLRTNMQFVNVDKAPHVIAVTSAVPGEGKTTTALNLAAALAEAGHRVCLVEADLRRPTLANKLGLVADAGFTTAIIGQAPVEAVLQNAGRNLAVLVCGPVPPNPSELLLTDQARAVINHIAEQVDYVVIDTAPLLPVADGAEIAALADATLVVHHSGKSTKDQAVHCLERLEQVGTRPVGIVLNMILRSRGGYDYNFGYYYSYRPQRRRDSRRGDDDTPATDITGTADTLDITDAFGTVGGAGQQAAAAPVAAAAPGTAVDGAVPAAPFAAALSPGDGPYPLNNFADPAAGALTTDAQTAGDWPRADDYAGEGLNGIAYAIGDYPDSYPGTGDSDGRHTAPSESPSELTAPIVWPDGPPRP